MVQLPQVYPPASAPTCAPRRLAALSPPISPHTSYLFSFVQSIAGFPSNPCPQIPPFLSPTAAHNVWVGWRHQAAVVDGGEEPLRCTQGGRGGRRGSGRCSPGYVYSGVRRRGDLHQWPVRDTVRTALVDRDAHSKEHPGALLYFSDGKIGGDKRSGSRD